MGLGNPREILCINIPLFGNIANSYITRFLANRFRVGPYRFYFYSHEPNEPPHVHIDRDGFSAKFWLKKVTLAANLGFAKKELNALHELVKEHQQHLLGRWNEYFGT